MPRPSAHRRDRDRRNLQRSPSPHALHARSTRQCRNREEGGIQVKKLIALLGATATIALSGLAGTASAGPSPTPSGLTGACNMLASWGAGANGGMANAMSVDNPNGNAGMWTAVWTSGNQPGVYSCG
jgi:hypothetical protein